MQAGTPCGPQASDSGKHHRQSANTPPPYATLLTRTLTLARLDLSLWPAIEIRDRSFTSPSLQTALRCNPISFRAISCTVVPLVLAPRLPNPPMCVYVYVCVYDHMCVCA
jgi:hypothetical protein